MTDVFICQSCKNSLPKATGMKFCPFCGDKVSLANSSNKQEKKESKSSLPPLFSEYDFCTVVLKFCVNKERMIEKLSHVLSRSNIAIRMAVEKMPCMIVYKGKASDLPPLVKVLDEERATYAVVSDDYETIQDIKLIFTNDYELLTKEEEKLLSLVPVQLWWGDDDYRVFNNVYRGQVKGLLIVSNMAVYFISQAATFEGVSWFVLPFNALERVIISDEEDECSIMLLSKENKKMTLQIENNDKLKELNKVILENKRKEDFATLMLCACEECGHHFKAFANTLSNKKESCRKCQGQMQYKLMKKAE